MTRPSIPCGLCGIRTWAKKGICTRCVHHALTLHRYNPSDELTGGRWVARGGIQVWQPEPAPRLRPRHEPIPLTMSPEDARRGRSQYVQGIRTEFAIAANREYQRAHKRTRRARKVAA